MSTPFGRGAASRHMQSHIAQHILEENEFLIHIIEDCHNRRKFPELMQYQSQFYSNLMFLTTIADTGQNNFCFHMIQELAGLPPPPCLPGAPPSSLQVLLRMNNYNHPLPNGYRQPPGPPQSGRPTPPPGFHQGQFPNQYYPQGQYPPNTPGIYGQPPPANFNNNQPGYGRPANEPGPFSTPPPINFLPRFPPMPPPHHRMGQFNPSGSVAGNTLPPNQYPPSGAPYPPQPRFGLQPQGQYPRPPQRHPGPPAGHPHLGQGPSGPQGLDDGPWRWTD